MKLLTIDSPPNGRPGVLSSKGEVIDILRLGHRTGVSQWLPGSVREILNAGPQGLDVIKEIVDRIDSLSEDRLQMLRQIKAIRSFDETPLLAAIPDPKLFLAAGMNSASHLKEMAEMVGLDEMKAPANPTAFIKLQSSLTGSGKPIGIPKQAPDQIDFEGELAFVVGRTCYNVSVSEAFDYIAGYTVVNDVSARDWIPEFVAAKNPMESPHAWERNILGKNFPSFTPFGPVITTADEIDDPHNLNLTSRLNGKVMQSANSNDLIRGVDEFLSYFSQWYRFQPGDVISTGSPPGVGYGQNPKVFMKEGDVIEVEIEKIGTLSNRVVSSDWI